MMRDRGRLPERREEEGASRSPLRTGLAVKMRVLCVHVIGSESMIVQFRKAAELAPNELLPCRNPPSAPPSGRPRHGRAARPERRCGCGLGEVRRSRRRTGESENAARAGHRAQPGRGSSAAREAGGQRRPSAAGALSRPVGGAERTLARPARPQGPACLGSGRGRASGRAHQRGRAREGASPTRRSGGGAQAAHGRGRAGRRPGARPRPSRLGPL
jgi:hypothetical protein